MCIYMIICLRILLPTILMISLPGRACLAAEDEQPRLRLIQPARQGAATDGGCTDKKSSHQLTYEEARQLRQMQGVLDEMHDETMDDRYRH